MRIVRGKGEPNQNRGAADGRGRAGVELGLARPEGADHGPRL